MARPLPKCGSASWLEAFLTSRWTRRWPCAALRPRDHPHRVGAGGVRAAPAWRRFRLLATRGPVGLAGRDKPGTGFGISALNAWAPRSPRRRPSPAAGGGGGVGGGGGGGGVGWGGGGRRTFRNAILLPRALGTRVVHAAARRPAGDQVLAFRAGCWLRNLEGVYSVSLSSRSRLTGPSFPPRRLRSSFLLFLPGTVPRARCCSTRTFARWQRSGPTSQPRPSHFF